MPSKKIIDKNLLYKLYITEQKSMIEISELLKLNRKTIDNNLIEYGFKENIKHNKRRRVDKDINLEKLKEKMYKLYILDSMTISQLMEEFKFTRYKIKQLLSEFNIIKEENKTKNIQPYDNKELLYKKYIIEKKSIQLIASELNCSDETISRKLKKFNIETRKNHVSFENKEKCYSNYRLLLKRSRRKFNNVLRIERLKIDKQECCICHSDKKLEVHHLRTIQDMVDNTLNYFPNIDLSIKKHRDFVSDIVQKRYDYNNINENMMTLCKKCHIGVHTNKITLNNEGLTTIPMGSTLEDWLPVEVLNISIKKYNEMKI